MTLDTVHLLPLQTRGMAREREFVLFDDTQLGLYAGRVCVRV